MKNQQQNNQQNQERKRTQNVSNSAGVAVSQHRTYKPRTPITKTYVNIMNDPSVFNC